MGNKTSLFTCLGGDSQLISEEHSGVGGKGGVVAGPEEKCRVIL